jgi:NTP pyrophosphatase (non-canonical NTP hydrolase)
MNSRSGLTNYQDECLLILQEECGEAVQEICKIKRFGITKESWHVEGQTHLQCLEQELGDLLAMIEMVRDARMGITEAGLQAAKKKKLEKVLKWMWYNKEDDK